MIYLKIIDLGIDIGDGRMIATDCDIKFRYIPIPVSIKSLDQQFGYKLAGVADDFHIVDNQIKAHIIFPFEPNEDPELYNYAPDFIDTDFEQRSSILTLTKRTLTAIRATRKELPAQ